LVGELQCSRWLQNLPAYVRDQLQQLPFTYQMLCGLTGTGKTYVLHQLGQRGAQVLDLEGLANHRGSLLGEEWEETRSQPKQNTLNRYCYSECKALNSVSRCG